MKLKDYYQELTKIMESYPEFSEYTVVFSKDDEGNEFNTVGYSPTVGYFDSEDRTFVPDMVVPDKDDLNAICLN